MDTDDLEPRAQPAAPLDLEKLSLEELNDYIARMEQEIARVRAAIAAKETHRSSAEGVFKT